MIDTKFLGKGWQIKEEDDRSLAILEVDFTKVKFISVHQGEGKINGEEALNKVKESDGIRLDARFFMALLLNFKEEAMDCVLEKLCQSGAIGGNGQEKDFRCIACLGTIFLDPDGNRCYLCLCREKKGEWSWNPERLDCDWDCELVAVLPED